jgi:uncharacterized membrane protein YwaF
MAMIPGNAVWSAYLVVMALIGVGLYLWLKPRSRSYQRWVLLGVAVGSWALFTVFILERVHDPAIVFPLSQNLPLQFCSIITCLLIPAVWFDWEPLRALCYYPGVLAGLMAVVSPAEVYTGYSVFSLSSIGFFSGHVFNVMIPILMAGLGWYKPTYKESVKALAYFTAMACAVFLVDLVLRAVLDPKINYWYFFDPEGAGVLVWLHSLVKVTFVYELLVLPFALLSFFLQTAIYRGAVALGARRRHRVAAA